MMKRDLRFSRRNLLQTIGAGAALLPLLESDRADAACVVTGIKRLYLLCWPNGMLSSINTWATKGNDPTSWQLATFQQTAGLTPYMSDLLLLEGVDYKVIRDMPGSGERTGHACYPAMLTGAYYQTLSTSTAQDIGGGPSVDQYIGSTLVKGGYNGLVSLNQGTFVQSTGHLSWKQAGQVVLPTLDVASVFNQLFAGQMTAPPVPTTAPTTTGTAMTPPPAPAPTVNNTGKIRKSILDYVIADLNRFSGIVGTADKQSIDAHLTSVRAMEMQIQNMQASGMPTASVAPGGPPAMITTSIGNAACSPPSIAGAPPSTTSANANVHARLQMDLGIAALAADYTRVVVMQICDQGGGEFVMNWMNDPSGQPYAAGGPNPPDHNTGDVNGFHAIAHRNVQEKVNVDVWFQQNIAYLISRMKGITDMSGNTMLNSSVIVGMNNMRAGLHDTTNVPVIMAGTCGGYFKTGAKPGHPRGHRQQRAPHRALQRDGHAGHELPACRNGHGRNVRHG